MRMDSAVLTASGTNSALPGKPIVKLNVEGRATWSFKQKFKRGWKLKKVTERNSL